MPWMIAPVETMVGTRTRGRVPVEGGELRVVERGAAPEPDHELDAVGEPAAQLLLVALVEPLGVNHSVRGSRARWGRAASQALGVVTTPYGGQLRLSRRQQAGAAADVDVGRGFGFGAVVKAAVFHV